MATDNNQSTSRLDEVIADYVRACEAGHTPDREHLLEQHADLKEDLRDFFHHRDRMEALLDPLRSAAARVLNIRCPHCRNSIELVDDAQISSINCPSCGSDFSLVGSSTASPPFGLERIGQFQLVEQVGVGQFGAVWKARDLALERTVAIKIPRRRHISSTDVEVFLRDARVSAQLTHPHIVGVHEVGKHEDAIYIVSDFIQGASLKDWSKANQLTINESVQLCATIANALDYAHESGVVHRDLKPGNIMMDLCGDPHIVDFGLAKHDAGEITMTVEGQILGTPAYMSPEQARGDAHHVDKTADIYSLGVILFELLTEELPFRGDKQVLLTQIVKDDPPSPRKLNNRIPRDLETICLKCLEKEPRNRYQTAHDFAEDCQRFLDAKPVSARPVSGVVKGVRWCRRNPVVAALSATVAMLLVGIAIVNSVGLMRTQRALDISNQRAEQIEENLYFSEMTLAGQAALKSEGLAEVRRLVGHWQVDESSADRRGWEWHYLNSLIHQDLVTMRGHEGGIFALDWSHDGAHLASASSDWSIRVWGSNGEAIQKLTCHSGVVRDLDWSQEKRLLASASEDGTARIFEAVDGKIVRSLQHDGPVTTVSWSPKGNLLATVSSGPAEQGSRNSFITVWNTETWESERPYNTQSVNVATMQWNPSGTHIAIASRRGKIIVLDVANGKVSKYAGKDGGQATCLAWNHDGTKLAYNELLESEVYVLTIDSQEVQSHTTGATVSCLAWHPNRSVLAYSDGNKSVQLRDCSTGSILRAIRGHFSRVTSVCWDPSGVRLATGDIAGRIKVWDVSGESEFLDGAATISWHPDGSRFASRFSESVIVREAKPAGAPQRLASHRTDVLSVAYSPDGGSIASLDYAREVQIWDVATNAVRCTIKTKLPYVGQRFPQLLAWSPDSRHLALAYDDRTIRIVAATSGETLHELPAEFRRLSCLAWHPSNSLLASGSFDGTIRLWDMATGKRETVKNLEVGYPVNCVGWSPDGMRLACASSEVVLVWDVNDEATHRLPGHTTFVNAVAWSPDGSRIASADESGSVRLWDAKTGQQTLTLEYPGGVCDLAWNPDGKSLSAIGYGGSATVRIWHSTFDRSETIYW